MASKSHHSRQSISMLGTEIFKYCGMFFRQALDLHSKAQLRSEVKLQEGALGHLRDFLDA